MTSPSHLILPGLLMAMAAMEMAGIALSDPQQDPAIALRGYGNVSANLTPNRAVFECEDVSKADILLDKLLADLFWDETNPPKMSEVKAGTSIVSVYSLPGQGAAVIARSGKSVVVLGAADQAQAAGLAAKEPLLLGRDVTSKPATTRPMYLDYYDNKAFKSYTRPMKSSKKFGLDSHWPFVKQFGLAGLAFYGPTFRQDNPAPNVIDWVATDYEVHAAEEAGGFVESKISTGEAPEWVYNTLPDEMMKASDTTLLGAWGGAGEAGGHYVSRSMSMDHRSELDLGFVRQIMERYKDIPNLLGWHFMGGSPGNEYAYHDRETHSWDSSPAGQEGWHHWLRDICGYSLADLGTRWYGDSSHFSSWDEVRVFDQNEFFGERGPDSFRLQTGWQWQNTASLDAPPSATGNVPIDMPPSQEQAFLPKAGANFFQTTFDPTNWWSQQKAKGASRVWLVMGETGTGGDATRISWNGTPFKLPNDPESKGAPFAVEVTDCIKAGSNQLVVGMDGVKQRSRGKLSGPVFLTVHEPKRIPYLGHQANARCYDLVQWQNWAYYEFVRGILAEARKLDPDRCYLISPGGGATDNFDYAVQLATGYGCGCQDTGREASYRPWWSGLGMLNGFYSTSEWSAMPPKTSPQGDMLDRGFGWILFEADSNHSFFSDLEDLMEREKENGWATRHRRQIELFGKYLRTQPKIVLLRSNESILLNSVAYKAWDLGRGELEANHYDAVYASERNVKDGLAEPYPVMIDTGSEFMEPDVVAAIRKYVENGGTFVALHNTGRHTALDPDSFPLASLSGFKVSDRQEQGKIRFESNLPVFKGWEGKEFEGTGQAIDSLKSKNEQNADISLEPQDGSAIPLARWSDGSIAVGYRKVGKGQIIVLGSTFWRDGKDDAGVWRSSSEVEAQFLDKLLGDCGVARSANASLPEIWARKMVTKNGLQNWLVSFNSTNAAQKADVWMETAEKPDQVYDLQADTPVPFVYENGGVSIKGVDFNPYEVKFFGVRHPSLVNGLDVWWHEKTTYWKKTPEEIAAASLVLPDTRQKGIEDVLPLNSWSFKADSDNTISAQPAWLQSAFNDSSWKTVNPLPWNLTDPALKDYHGTGLYRVKFTVPEDWKGRRVLLCFSSWDTPVVYDQGDFYVNGLEVDSYKAKFGNQTLEYDITAQIHPGDNILALRVAGGAEFGGIGGAIWIESWTPLSPAIDLSGQWQVVKGDGVTRQDAPVPGKSTGKYLTRDIKIPADWKGKSIFLEWSSNAPWVSSVVINGRPISYNAYSHPFGLWSRINVSPSLKPGETNTIEFWHMGSVSAQSDDPKKAESKGLQLSTINIGCK